MARPTVKREGFMARSALALALALAPEQAQERGRLGPESRLPPGRAQWLAADRRAVLTVGHSPGSEQVEQVRFQ